MQMILKYLSQYEEFEIEIFKEETIKNEPVEVIHEILHHFISRTGRDAMC